MTKFNLTASKNDIKKRLDVFITENIDTLTRSQVKQMLASNVILLNGKKPQKAGVKLEENDKIEVEVLKKEPIKAVAQNIPIDIVYEDDYLAVVNKAQGMVVHPAVGNYDNTLVNALLYHMNKLSDVNDEIRPGIVHRLDKNTSGLLVIAKTNEVHTNLAEQIKEKTAKRVYRAIVSGIIDEDEGVIDKNLERSKMDRKKIAVTTDNRGKRAVTHYKVLKRLKGFTYVEFSLETGRTHQIRVHSKYLGHPVLGDPEYGFKYKNIKLNGQLLHAYKLSFIHPKTLEEMTFIKNEPEYFIKYLKKLSN